MGEADNAIAARAEGYAFPTNLDRDPPVGGMAPKTQQDFNREALKEGWAPEVFDVGGPGAGQPKARPEPAGAGYDGKGDRLA